MSHTIAKTGRALWRWRVDETPDRVFLRNDGRTWTYGEFDLEVRTVAAGLRRLGVGQGTRVLLGITNRPELLQLQHALQLLGAVAVPLVPGLTLGELAYPINHSQGRLLLADDPIASMVAEQPGACPGLEQMLVLDGAGGFDELLGGPPLGPVELDRYDERSLLLVLYTSGSTGRPKGVMIGAGSAYSCGEGFVDRFRLTGEDNYYLPLPLGHAIGALTAQSITLHTGGQLTLDDRFAPSRFWPAVEESGATTSILFPAQLNLLLEADTGRPAYGESSLRLVITHAYLGRFRDRFGVELGMVWGMTETGAVCTGSAPGYRGERGEGYIGAAMKGAELAVLDDSLRRLPPGTPGEICFRHPHVMLGYLDDPEATAATLADGWVRSGDIGVVDEQGHGWFQGRIKNVIKRSGENISPEEVEVALAGHPDVAECLVFAVPDRLRTEEVAAVVVRRQGTIADPAELRASCTGALARWKLPRYIAVVDEPLPRLPNGKVDRTRLQDSLDLAAMWDAEPPGRG